MSKRILKKQKPVIARVSALEERMNEFEKRTFGEKEEGSKDIIVLPNGFAFNFKFDEISLEEKISALAKELRMIFYVHQSDRKVKVHKKSNSIIEYFKFWDW